jgi:anti-sigma factor RsiW
MTCREFQQLFVSLAFDDLPAEQRQRARAHLGQCPSCAREWEAYQKVIALAHQLTPAPVPPGVSQRVRDVLTRRDRGDGSAGGSGQ